MPVGKLEAPAVPWDPARCIRCGSENVTESHYCKGCADDYELAFGFRPGEQEDSKATSQSTANE